MMPFYRFTNDPFIQKSGSYTWLKWIVLVGGSLVILIVIFSVYIHLSIPDVRYLKKSNPKSTALFEQRKQEAEEAGKKLFIRQYWVSYGTIPELLKKSVRISEDANFFWHEGIDYDELMESLKKNIEEKSFKRGGSTITQQLAKNLFLSTEKSILRKIKEYYIAQELEKYLSKARIFHLYLNIIEFGRGIFGVQAAALTYFGKNVDELNLNEIVRLTAVIPRPLTVNPTSNSRWLKWRCRWISHKLKLYGFIEEDQFEELISLFK